MIHPVKLPGGVEAAGGVAGPRVLHVVHTPTPGFRSGARGGHLD